MEEAGRPELNIENLTKQLSDALGIETNKEAGHISPLILAYIGDTLFDLAVRFYLIETHDSPVNILHRMSSKRVRAAAQAQAARTLVPDLSAEEMAQFLRGRNAKPGGIPKNAEPEDYALATALECLLGWLFLSGRDERLWKVARLAIDAQPADNPIPQRPYRPS